MIWQVGTNELPIVEASTGKTYNYENLDVDYKFPGMWKTYGSSGYFRLWHTEVNYTSAQQDLVDMGCSQSCSCTATYDLSASACFGCDCETEATAVAAGYRNSFFSTEMTEAITFATVFVNNGRVVVLTAMFETMQPSLGLGWTPSYMLFSLQKIELAYFIFVYLIMALFCIFSLKQVKDQKWSYLASLWNIFDVVNLVLFLVGLVLAIVFMVKYDDFTSVEPIDVDQTTLLQMMSAADWQQQSMLLFGINQLIMNVKLIKYIQALDFIPGLAMPMAALQEAGIEMLAFMVTLLMICLGFSQTFTAWFGDRFVSYHTTGSSFTTMMLSLAGYPNFKELGAHTLQNTMQKTGLTLLSIYCYFFIFFFLVMLVAIQHMAYNKVRHQFLKEARRFLTLGQFCKLLNKKFKQAKAEVGQPHDSEDKKTFKGSWWAWNKHQMKLYWQENFADLSETGPDTNDSGDLGGGPHKLNKYEAGRADQVHLAMNHLGAMSEMHGRLASVLAGVTQTASKEVSDSEDEDDLEEEIVQEKQHCCWTLLLGERKSEEQEEAEFEEGEAQMNVEPNPMAAKDEDKPDSEYQTGEQVCMAAGACDKALCKMEELDHNLRSIVERQQQQQANILHNCDLIVSAYSNVGRRKQDSY
eukprot:TRINITY_DN6632_c0_g1_i3.p1 TRINITY_DN6632_c0_g1~~TRINITY_DN6632_c0_g1_i3.p1  ORF type:complete len:639 (+),score=172.59 TRINITY_DN6632_c0_g1_i3:511-2427(+)